MLMDQDYLSADYMHILQEQLQNSFTQELSLKSNRAVGGFWHWAAGGFFSKQWLKTNGPVFFDDAMTAPIGNAIQQQMYTAIHASMVKKMMAQGMPEIAANAAAKAAIEKAGGISMTVRMVLLDFIILPKLTSVFIMKVILILPLIWWQHWVCDMIICIRAFIMSHLPIWQ